MSWQINAFKQNDLLVENLSRRIATQLRAGIERRGSASLAVSGGSTPKTLFQALSREDLPWEYVWITLVDERWVAEDHPDSNARLVRENLLQNHAAKAHFVGLKSEDPTPFSGQQVVAARLRQLAMPFDVVLLGMGGDGHTASFFPGAEALRQALDPQAGECCLGVHPPAAPHDRMTLTLATLLNAKMIVLHLVGEEKWQVLHNAIGEGNVEDLPIRAVLNQQRVPVEIYYGAEA